MNIRPAIAADLPAIIALERLCATAAHWSELQYRKSFGDQGNDNRSRRLILVIEEIPDLSPALNSASPALFGFLIARDVDHEWELENIAVANAVRRRGLATRLLQELLRRARTVNGESVFLEVRESNQLARALYEKLGFVLSGRRRAYYQGPAEDALIYRRSLP
ncbi:MAG TPA: ribosomal protein S18-alanine N-acetyltransferase [Candidatus Sulfotelmatobacter sp.]